MPGLRTKLAIAAVATAVIAAILWASRLQRERADASIVLRENRSAEDLLAARGHSAAAKTPVDDQSLVREPISAEDVQRLFTGNNDIFVHDAFTYYRFRGGQRRRLDFPEHEGGFFVQETSEEGFIESFTRLPRERDFLAVVTGDSHTEGLCSTHESFANRLEAMLAQRNPARVVEVLNTGLTGYSFYNYLGVLEKLLPEKPDAFVVAFYGGNDFLDVMKPWHYFHHTTPPKRGVDYFEKLRLAASVSGGAVANAFNQLLFFHDHPDQIELALAGAKQACAEIGRLCAEHGIALVYVHIPPAFARAGELDPILARALEALGLQQSDLAQYDRLADELILALRAADSEVIDLREEFQRAVERYYWTDLHVNVDAHSRIGELLLPRIEPRLRAGRAR